MEIKGIGIDVPDGKIDGDMSAFRRELDFFAECGFDAVELTVPGLYLIVGGRLDQKRAQETIALLEQYPFTYTLHLPDEMNLATSSDSRMEQAIFTDCLDFAAQARAKIAVYHCGLSLLHASDPRQVDDARRREVDTLRVLAEKAGKHHILIAVENSDPHRGESEVLAERGISGREARIYHPALDPVAVAAEVEEIDHPAVGMTLDFGHFFLASHLTGQEYLPAIEQVAGSVRHLHLNDNFGNNPPGDYSRMEQAMYGLGDCHLPPGFGRIPLRESFERLAGYSGYIILELRPAYELYFADAVRRVRELIKV